MPGAGTQVTGSDAHLPPILPPEGASGIRQSLTLPGHAEQVPKARAFIATALAARGATLPSLKSLDVLLRATAEIGARYSTSAAAD